MRVYDSFGPNPRAMRMFLLEKGLTLPTVAVDILGAENRRAPYTDKNPGGQLPALELDDGRVLGETVAIFEYLEERQPNPPLIGRTPEERAETRMWQRRIELNITEHLYNGFRWAEGLELFRPRMRVLPEAAAGLKAIVRDKLAWLDGLVGDGPFVAGGRFTIADIILFAAVEFGGSAGQPLDPTLANLGAWHRRVS
ncbi:MAG TPA: glutathione S-transferase family protein, partial [Candidatus Binatia bacterium]|nr:glutathione S-transferase family protein [Candidatus Binatia bacterium]